VNISRKSFRLGKFVQDLNALQVLHKPHVSSDLNFFLSVVDFDSEGVYYFIEQLVWLAKSGPIDLKWSRSSIGGLGKVVELFCN
ncbi:hypothetical protein HN873_035010, partial [Arachis hypogaea]